MTDDRLPLSSGKRKKRIIVETVRRVPTPIKRSEKCDSHILSGDACSSEEVIVSISIMDPIAIDRLAKTKPMDAAFQCRDALVTLSTGFNNRKLELLAATCGIAYNMTAVDGEWRKFCKDDFWHLFKRRPKQSFRGLKKALRWVMRFVFHAQSKNEINLTNRYAKMLEKEFNEGKSQSEIVEIIKGYRGIEGMRKARVASRKKARERAIKKSIEEDKEFFDSLKDDPPDAKEREYRISAERHKVIRAALKRFQTESKAYFKSRVVNN